ncbi:c-type cytochrome [Spongiibacter sp. KMU-158]|uniref:Methylamine utilization protein MauG n=2 Tax=Spongiibacter pelagi TaxID=2760804 RepID=A0A927C1N6_9GAMM|nr:c-type cytochrome [Spongiibacter pelagi]
MYYDYHSLQNAGVGGLKIALPELRQGFSPQKIDLGRLLFFDPILSKDSSVACASCHDPDKGFADGRAVSVGIDGQLTERSAPSLWNAGFLQRLFWDGRAASLEAQIIGPLFAPNEMAATPDQLLHKLQASADYRALFQQAFGAGEINLEWVYEALAAFESSLVSLNSRYDLYANGYHQALTEPEIEGMNVFRSFVARCAECHTPPLFTNQQIAVLGTPEPEGKPLDPGAQRVTGDPSQRGGFKVPSLRNVALTAPYMHSGRFATLRDAVAFYTGGRGHAVPEGEQLSLHWHIWEPNLTDAELDRLVDFLQTLTDESFKPQVPAQLPSGLAPVVGTLGAGAN